MKKTDDLKRFKLPYIGLKETMFFLQLSKPPSTSPGCQGGGRGGIITQHGLPPGMTQLPSPSSQVGAKEYSKALVAVRELPITLT